MEYKDYYATLGVAKNASQDDIQKAYRRLARKYHPDVSKESNAEDKFKNLQEAYEVLKDPEKRSAYDQLGANWKAGQEFRPPPGWDQQRSHFYTGGDFSESDLGGFSEFFSNIFGGGGRARTRTGRASPFGREEQFGGFAERGQDVNAKVRITLDEAFRGGSKTVQLQMPEVDPATGRVMHKNRTLKITIPVGAVPGQQLRLAGQGLPGMGGGSTGDLYLEIDVEPHRFFTLQGHDIYLTLPITPWEAALGAQVKVPTLAGTVDLKIPSGSQSGQKLRLKGRGLPKKPASGDQYAILQTVVPVPKTSEDKQLYETMSHIMPENPRKDWPT